MGATFTRTSHTKDVLRRMDTAKRAGLIAGGNVLRNAVKRGLRGGYTTGNFVTGAALNSVTLGEPQMTTDGGWIDIGSRLDYPLYWELGHFNLFTGQYERVEVWAPAFREHRGAARDAYVRAYRAVMRTGGGVGRAEFGAVIDGTRIE